MDTEPPMADSDNLGLNKIIRRDLDCQRDKGGVGRMSQVEQDRYMLVVILEHVNAQLRASQRQLEACRAARDRLAAVLAAQIA